MHSTEKPPTSTVPVSVGFAADPNPPAGQLEITAIIHFAEMLAAGPARIGYGEAIRLNPTPT